MLVYANVLTLAPEGGVQEVIRLFADWASANPSVRQRVDPNLLGAGVRELRFRSGGILSSRATLDNEKQPCYPYMFSARFIHGDLTVRGRRWITEFGLRESEPGEDLTCSILLKTEEISTKIIAPVQVSRPFLVQLLIDQTNPVYGTPGLRLKVLDEEGVRALPYEIEREDRRYPIVMISTAEGGNSLVDVEYLRTQIVGLADVILLPEQLALEARRAIGDQRYLASNGAVRIIFPARKGGAGAFYETSLIGPEDIAALKGEGRSVETEILGAITHRTNVPNSWRHISIEVVSQAILRQRLAQAIESARNSDQSEQIKVFTSLLEEADDQLKCKDENIEELLADLADHEDGVRRLEAQVDSLQHALSARAITPAGYAEDAITLPTSNRGELTKVLGGSGGLCEILNSLAALFPERVKVLPTAIESARDADQHGFKHASKALDLLLSFVTGYWEALAGGQGDHAAKSVFGKNDFAAKESVKLSNAGRKRRTFEYAGKQLFMEKHLKLGIKDSAAETLRVHFEWIAEHQQLLIGHCGRHLDF